MATYKISIFCGVGSGCDVHFNAHYVSCF